jgi:hypothetical protein
MNPKLNAANEGGQIVPFCLSVSNILLKTRNGNEQNLANISKMTAISCKRNNLRRVAPSVFDQLFPFTDEISSATRLLNWIVKNSYRLQLKGVTNLILDTLHDANIHEASEIVSKLKKIRSLGINVLTFDNQNNIIKVGSMDDLISSNDHLNIIVNSLMSKVDVCESKSNDLHVAESEADPFEGEHDFDNQTLIRIPVWLEVQTDGSMLVVAKNQINNKQLLKHAKVQSLMEAH